MFDTLLAFATVIPMTTFTDKDNSMRKCRKRTTLIALIGLLLLSTACSRGLHSHTGSESIESTEAAHQRANGAGRSPAVFGAGSIPALADSRPLDQITAESLARQQHMIDDPAFAVPNSRKRSGAAGEASLAASEGSWDERQRAEGSAAAAAAGLQDVFFAFDSSIISDEARKALLHDTAWLQAHPRETLVIEGHCDGRGTLDYNLVLGEKRAKILRMFLLDQQINPGRLTIVSYGKERPFCVGSEESCYQQNRRGHLLVRVKTSQ